jgi:hypothetical protein
MRKIITLVALLLAFSTPGFAADISGSWELEMTNQMGQIETWTLGITADGGALTIDAVHPMFGNVAGTGTLSGSAVTMHLSVAGGVGKVVVDFEGEVTGNKMGGTRKVSYDHSDDAGGASGPGAPGGELPNSGMPGGTGGQGGMPPGGDMPAGAGGPPGGGAPEGGGPGGGAPEGGGPAGGAPAGGDIPDTWTAVRK